MAKEQKKHDLKEEDSGLDESLVDEFIQEMDALVKKYPEDPDQIDLNEERLTDLISDLDKSWMLFKRRWKNRLDTTKIMGIAQLREGKNGMRHLVIKSESSQEDLIDLVVPEDEE